MNAMISVLFEKQHHNDDEDKIRKREIGRTVASIATLPYLRLARGIEKMTCRKAVWTEVKLLC